MGEIIQKYDVIVIGGGPAGMAAALYAGRARLKTALFENGVCGGQIFTTDMVDNYPGLAEGVSGPKLSGMFEAHVRRFGAQIIQKEVTGLFPEDESKIVEAGGKRYIAKIIVIASGATYNKLGIPGEKKYTGFGVSYCATCDAPFFRDQKIVVVGGGDAACEEAMYLARFGKEVAVVHRRDEFRAMKIVQEKLRSVENVSYRLSHIPLEIVGDDQEVKGIRLKNLKTDETFVEPADGVFIFVGQTPNTGFAKGVVPMDETGHLLVNINMETEASGIFAVGDVRQDSARQVASSVGDGVTAACALKRYFA